MLFRIDPASGVAIFDQLAASVRSELARGNLKPGQRLPSAREVADTLQINIHTVLRAYQLLRDDGLVDLRRGRGAVVTDAATVPPEVTAASRDLVAKARRAGVTSATLLTLIREEYQS
jgi:GntR family transcriptional regulator